MGTKDSRSRWRWVILASSFCSLLITGFAQYNAGVMKVVLLRHLSSDVLTTTWLSAYYSGAFALTAPVGSLLINLANCRACVLLSGVFCLLGFVLSSLVTDIFYLFFTLTLVGIGQGMAFSGSLVILGYYFPDHASIVSGVSIAGGALGIFLHPPLLQALADWYGLQGAFLLSGAVAFQSSVCGALMRPARDERTATKSKQQGSPVQRICHVMSDACSGHMVLLTSWPVLTFIVSVFLLSTAYHAVVVLLPAFLIQYSGLTPTQASFSVSISGIASFFSRIASGFFAHDKRVGSLLCYCGMLGVQSLVSFAAPSLFALGIKGAYAYCVMLGLYSGGSLALMFSVLYELVGLHHSSTAFGMATFLVGVGSLLGAPLAELVYEDSYSSHALFGFIAAVFLGSAFFGSLVTVLPSNTLTQKQSPSDKKPSSEKPPLEEGDSSAPELQNLLHQTACEKDIVVQNGEKLSQHKDTAERVLPDVTIIHSSEMTMSLQRKSQQPSENDTEDKDTVALSVLEDHENLSARHTNTSKPLIVTPE